MVYKNQKIKIIYVSRGAKTGLTDVKLNLWDPDGSKVVNNKAMSEQGNGIYYYNFIPTKEGLYYGYADSTSLPLRRNIELDVVSKPAGGSVTKIYQRLPESEIREILDRIEALVNELNAVSNTINSNLVKIQKQNKANKALLKESNVEIVSSIRRTREMLSKRVDSLEREYYALRESHGNYNRNLLGEIDRKISIINRELDAKRAEEIGSLVKSIETLNLALTTESNMTSEFRKSTEQRIASLQSSIEELAKLIISTLPDDKLAKLMDSRDKTDSMGLTEYTTEFEEEDTTEFEEDTTGSEDTMGSEDITDLKDNDGALKGDDDDALKDREVGKSR